MAASRWVSLARCGDLVALVGRGRGCLSRVAVGHPGASRGSLRPERLDRCPRPWPARPGEVGVRLVPWSSSGETEVGSCALGPAVRGGGELVGVVQLVAVVLVVVLVVRLGSCGRAATAGDSATAAECFSPPPCPASARGRCPRRPPDEHGGSRAEGPPSHRKESCPRQWRPWRPPVVRLRLMLYVAASADA
jgi:hypothetical protein